MSYTRVRTTGLGTTAGGTLNLSFSALPSAGNLIVVHLAGFTNTSGPTWAVTDNQGNTYHERGNGGNFSGFGAAIWYTYNIGAPSGTFTVTVTGSTRIAASAVEWSGFSSSDPGNASGGTTFALTTTITATASSVTSEATALVVSVFACNGVSTVGTPEVVSPTWTTEWDNVAGGFPKSEANSRVVTSAGTEHCTWTTNAAAGGSTAICTFADPTIYTAPRATQIVQSVAVNSPIAPVQLTQVLQSYAVQGSVGIRVTQVVQTVAVLRDTQSPGDTPGVAIPTTANLWRLLRFDTRRRMEQTP